MNYEHALTFFLDVLKKCHINTQILSPFDGISAIMDSRLSNIVGLYPSSDVTIQTVFGPAEHNIKYKFVNHFKLRYIYIRLPFAGEKNLLFIGPYLSSPLSPEDIMEIGEQTGLPLDVQKKLKEYYSFVPVLTENNHLFSVIDTFCEHIWKTSSFDIIELNKNDILSVSSDNRILHGDHFDETLADIEMMEMRYALENELIQAVIHGQRHKEQLFSLTFNNQLFGNRISDPVRNAQNYCIILNTLLRKAAEQGGVHPLYIDRISSDFAAKIERLSQIKTVSELMREMFSSYCRLVYKHSMREYSPVVQKAILLIESDISAELSLKTLANAQGISSGYLATIFKRETGKTISEYVRSKRMKHAMYLLSTTHLQVQTIALHCGIIDVQYFSKLFKKQTGKTPKEYRENMRGRT